MMRLDFDHFSFNIYHFCIKEYLMIKVDLNTYNFISWMIMNGFLLNLCLISAVPKLFQHPAPF